MYRFSILLLLSIKLMASSGGGGGKLDNPQKDESFVQKNKTETLERKKKTLDFPEKFNPVRFFQSKLNKVNQLIESDEDPDSKQKALNNILIEISEPSLVQQIFHKKDSNLKLISLHTLSELTYQFAFESRKIIDNCIRRHFQYKQEEWDKIKDYARRKLVNYLNKYPLQRRRRGTMFYRFGYDILFPLISKAVLNQLIPTKWWSFPEEPCDLEWIRKKVSELVLIPSCLVETDTAIETKSGEEIAGKLEKYLEKIELIPAIINETLDQDLSFPINYAYTVFLLNALKRLVSPEFQKICNDLNLSNTQSKNFISNINFTPDEEHKLCDDMSDPSAVEKSFIQVIKNLSDALKVNLAEDPIGGGDSADSTENNPDGCCAIQ